VTEGTSEISIDGQMAKAKPTATMYRSGSKMRGIVNAGQVTAGV
jgi:hypothetical protein